MYISAPLKGGRRHQGVSPFYRFPLGAFKSQLGGTYILAVGLYRHRRL